MRGGDALPIYNTEFYVSLFDALFVDPSDWLEQLCRCSACGEKLPVQEVYYILPPMDALPDRPILGLG